MNATRYLQTRYRVRYAPGQWLMVWGWIVKDGPHRGKVYCPGDGLFYTHHKPV